MVGSVAIGKPERHVCKALHLAASNNRDHVPRSLFRCLFAPHIRGIYLRAHSVRGELRILAQGQQSGYNSRNVVNLTL